MHGGQRNWVLAAILAATILCVLLHIGLGGTGGLSIATVLEELAKGPKGAGDNLIVWQLRLPRALGCLCVGLTLGSVGAAFQALFRNPLADPFVVGVSSGASLGGIVAMMLHLSAFLGILAFPICGFVGGLLSLSLVFFLAGKRRQNDVTHLLLAGTVTGSLLAALQSMALLLGGQDANRVLQWLLGSMTVLQWPHIALMLPLSFLGSMALLLQARRLNALAVGEQAAQRVGVDVPKLRNAILGIGAAMVAASIGIVGIVGFVGLAAPHISRRLLGVDWRLSLAGSGLTGAALLLLADIVCMKSGDLLPVGVVTAVLGAPSLLIIMRNRP